jgi:hypothetical protein
MEGRDRDQALPPMGTFRRTILEAASLATELIFMVLLVVFFVLSMRKEWIKKWLSVDEKRTSVGKRQMMIYGIEVSRRNILWENVRHHRITESCASKSRCCA